MKRTGEIYSFEDLEVWKKARELRKEMSALVKGFPGSEKFRLSDQVIRCSRSVTANIAEGYGRFHYQENIQFCRQARGSLYELLDHLICAKDEQLIDDIEFQNIKKEILQCIKLLNGYISYLNNAKLKNKTEEPIIPYTLSPNN